MFDRRSRIIKDGSTMSFDYVPEKVVGREGELADLERMFSPLAFDKRACSAFLWGGVGSGKTVTAKRFCMNMEAYFRENNRLMRFIHINCRIKNTEYSVVLEIMRLFDKGFPDRGFSLDEILTLIKRSMEKEKVDIVVILDEVDALFNNNSRNLVYQLSRFSEDLTSSTMSLIMVSQYSVANVLDEASMSTFRRANTVSFERYTYEGLRNIIVYRAGLALEDGALTEDGIDLLAHRSEDFSDARFAIEVMERAAHVAESKGESEISLDSIRTASSSIYSDVSENKLADLNLNQKLALLAIARAIKNAPNVSMTRCEKTYAVVCEEYNVPAKKHTQFYTYVRDMDGKSLLRTEVKREPDGGRVTYISIDNIPPKELANKLEYLLDYEFRGEKEIE